MRTSDWSSDVCSSDLGWDRRSSARASRPAAAPRRNRESRSAPSCPFLLRRTSPAPPRFRTKPIAKPRITQAGRQQAENELGIPSLHEQANHPSAPRAAPCVRSEEHTSELQSLMRSSSAVFCCKNKKKISQ